MKADWVSWLAHLVVCSAVLCPFGIIRSFGGFDLVAEMSTVMAVFYAVREILQVRVLGWKGRELDTIMDVIGPIGLCVSLWLTGG